MYEVFAFKKKKKIYICLLSFPGSLATKYMPLSN